MHGLGRYGGFALLVAVAAAYAVCSEMAYRWFEADGTAASFFPAAGVTLALLVLTDVRMWPFVVGGAAAAELIMDTRHGIGLAATLGYILANALEPIVGAGLLRLSGSRPDIARTRDLARFLGFAVVVGPAVGAVLGATTYVRLAAGEGWARFALEWFVGDGLGVLVVGGAVLGAVASLPTSARRLHGAEGALLALGAIVVTAVTFWSEVLPLALGAVALLFLIALRCGTRFASAAGAGMAFVAAQATATGHRFWEAADVPTSTGMLYMQLSLALLLVTSLALAAEALERELAVRASSRAEAVAGAERERATRSALLQRLAARTAAATRPDEVGQALVDETIAAFHATTVVLALVDDEGLAAVVNVGGHRPASEAVLSRLVREGARTPLAEALRHGRIEMFRTREEGTSRYPDVVRLPVELAAIVAMPIDAAGERVGAIAWGFDREQVLGEETIQLMRTIAAQTATAIERSRLSMAEHRLAEELQSAMLPEEVERTEGTAVAVRYAPSVRGFDIGGDWYDVIPLSDTVVALAVGDVVGRGPRASAAMGQLRSAVRALAHAVDDPADLLTQLDTFAESVQGARFATALYARVDLKSREIWYAAAAHPPPLVVTEGSAVRLDDGRSTPLCVTLAEGRRSAKAALEPGATLVLYTDGLVERRHESIDAGIERLANAAATGLESDLEALADSLLARVPPADSSDDAALVLFRILPVTAGLYRRLPATPGALREIRSALAEWLDAHRVPDPDGLILACNEAVANAVEHAYASTVHGEVEVSGEITEDGVTLTVSDFGRWNTAPSDPHRGRGTKLMQRLCDHVSVRPSDGGTTVTLHRAAGTPDAPRELTTAAGLT